MDTEQINSIKLDCSFCGTAESDVDFLVEGENAYICDSCVAKASDIVKSNLNKNLYGLTFNLQKKKFHAKSAMFTRAETSLVQILPSNSVFSLRVSY